MPWQNTNFENTKDRDDSDQHKERYHRLALLRFQPVSWPPYSDRCGFEHRKRPSAVTIAHHYPVNSEPFSLGSRTMGVTLEQVVILTVGYSASKRNSTPTSICSGGSFVPSYLLPTNMRESGPLAVGSGADEGCTRLFALCSSVKWEPAEGGNSS